MAMQIKLIVVVVVIRFMLQKPEICNGLIGHVARMQTSPTYACMNSSLLSRLGFTLKIQSVLGIGNRRAYNIFLVIQ